MPHPIPLPLRNVILRRSQQGHSTAAIARSLGLVPRTVRHLLRRIRLRGQDAVAASYSGAAPSTIQVRELVEEALRLRREHPTWGAGLVCVFLRRGHPGQPIPAERTVQRWFERAGLSPAPSGRRPGMNLQRAQHPHEVWQMDAAERVRLGNGAQASWLRIADECSGAVLQTAVFPPRLLEQRVRQRRADRAAPNLQTLGTALALPRGQWGAVGVVR